MGKKNLSIGLCAVLASSCAQLMPPSPETEITLKDALLDTTGSLTAMKDDLAARGKSLNMYVDDVTVEFYVKGSRQAVAKMEGEGGLVPPGFAKSLVIKPSYTATADGERQNKITIKFKNTVTLTKEQRDFLESCKLNSDCISSYRHMVEKNLLPANP